MESATSNQDDFNSEKVAAQLAKDYAEYFKVDIQKEQSSLDLSLEEVLTSLEEYGSLLDRTKSESRYTQEVLVPQIHSHCQTLYQTFKSIDQLEEVVMKIKKNVGQWEAAVAKAERDLCHDKPVNAILKPLFFKRDIPIPNRVATFTPPPIFNSEDFFSSELSGQESERV